MLAALCFSSWTGVQGTATSKIAATESAAASVAAVVVKVKEEGRAGGLKQVRVAKAFKHPSPQRHISPMCGRRAMLRKEVAYRERLAMPMPKAGM